MALALALSAPATNTAFFVVFGLFVVAMLVLVAIIIVWAVRHDIAGRRVWRQHQEAAIRDGQVDELAPYPVPQNRLQQRANERAQQRQRRPRAAP